MRQSAKKFEKIAKQRIHETREENRENKGKTVITPKQAARALRRAAKTRIATGQRKEAIDLFEALQMEKFKSTILFVLLVLSIIVNGAFGFMIYFAK